jgi:hypothetical protein
MLKVKLSIGDSKPNPTLSEYFDNNTTNEVFFDTSPTCKKADFWFIIDNVNESDSDCIVASNRIFWFDTETMFPTGHYFTRGLPNFLSQFARAYTFEEIPTANKFHSPPFLPWMINSKEPTVAGSFYGHFRDYKYLKTVAHNEKNILLSAICSTKSYTENHKIRLRFIEKLSADLGDKFLWVGNGKLTIDDKFEITSQSKYQLVIENKIQHDVFSEKLYDAFLGASFPIYAGSPNIGEYFHDESILSINLRDYEKSLDAIKQRISKDLTPIELDSLEQNKNRVLSEFNLIKRLYSIALNSNNLVGIPTHNKLFPKKHFLDNRVSRYIYSSVGRYFKHKLN